MLLIDETNIVKFLLDGGKFVFANDNYKNYTTTHLLNSIFLSPNTFRGTSIYPNTINGANASIPVQQADVDNIKRILKDARLSVNDKICVYAEPDGELLNAFFIIAILKQFGFKNVAYLNMEYKKLSPDLFTQDYPTWQPVCGDYEFTDLSIQAQEVAFLNQQKLAKLIDVRPPNDFAGVSKTFKVNGHAPNAINIFWKRFFTPISQNPLIVSNKFIPFADIEKILLDNGLSSKDNIILTCNSGSEITSHWFVLALIFNWPSVKLFSGYWNVYQYLHKVDPIKFTVEK